jgi:hypothetical protein
MQKGHLVSHADAEQLLRRTGHPQEQIDEMLRQLPDPIDTERDATALVKLGLSASSLVDRMGGSP